MKPPRPLPFRLAFALFATLAVARAETGLRRLSSRHTEDSRAGIYSAPALARAEDQVRPDGQNRHAEFHRTQQGRLHQGLAARRHLAGHTVHQGNDGRSRSAAAGRTSARAVASACSPVPIFIEGAEPGDTLEVRVVDLTVQSDFAINRTISNMGHPLATMTPAPMARVYKIDRTKNKVVFNTIRAVPFWPYLGEMGITPSEEMGTSPANLLRNSPAAVSTVPISARARRSISPCSARRDFPAGGGKATGANGKVNFFGMEVPLTAYLQFIVHKGKACPASAPKNPRTTSPSALPRCSMWRCDSPASKWSTSSRRRPGLDFFIAYRSGSLAIDFNITRANTNGQLMHTTIPKYIFIRIIGAIGTRANSRQILSAGQLFRSEEGQFH